MKHFKLTSEKIVNFFGVELFRIELTIDCKWGKIGDKGGFVQKEENISGEAWVSGNALVYGDARVYGNACVSGEAWVYGNACVSGEARVSGNARVSGDAWVSGNAWETSPLQIQGSRHFVAECKKGYLKIGCKEFSFEAWNENLKTIGKEQGYTEQQIKEYGLYIDLAIKLSQIK